MRVIDWWFASYRRPVLEHRPFRMFVNGRRPGHGNWYVRLFGWGVASFWLVDEGGRLRLTPDGKGVLTGLRFGRVTTIPGPDYGHSGICPGSSITPPSTRTAS